MSLSTDQNFVFRTFWADSASFIDWSTDQGELWFSLTNNSWNTLTCVDSNFYAEFVSIFELNCADVTLDDTCKINNSYRMMTAEKSWINVSFTNFESTTCHVGFANSFYFLDTILFTKLVKSIVNFI